MAASGGSEMQPRGPVEAKISPERLIIQWGNGGGEGESLFLAELAGSATRSGAFYLLICPSWHGGFALHCWPVGWARGWHAMVPQMVPNSLWSTSTPPLRNCNLGHSTHAAAHGRVWLSTGVCECVAFSM